MTETKANQIAKLLGKITGILIVGVAVLTLKAWLLALVLGWLGVAAFGFWKAVVAVVLVDALLYTRRR